MRDAAIADFKTEDVGKHVYLEARDAYNIMTAAVVDLKIEGLT